MSGYAARSLRSAIMSSAASAAESLRCTPVAISFTDSTFFRDLVLADEHDIRHADLVGIAHLRLELFLLAVQLRAYSGASQLRRGGNGDSPYPPSSAAPAHRTARSPSRPTAAPARPARRRAASALSKCRRRAARGRYNTRQGCHTARRSRRSLSPDGRSSRSRTPCRCSSPARGR